MKKGCKSQCCKVLKKFGTTKKFECAGFIMPDGKMVNICKKGKKGQTYVHEEVVSSVVKGSKGNEYEALWNFIDECGAVRFRVDGRSQSHGKMVRAVASKKPTEAQARKMAEAVSQDTDVFLGLRKSTDTEPVSLCQSNVLEDARGLDVRRWIGKCW